MPVFTNISPYKHTIVGTNIYLAFITEYHSFPVIVKSFVSVTPAPVEPVFPVDLSDSDAFPYNTSVISLTVQFSLNSTF